MGLFKEKDERYLDRTKFRSRAETIDELRTRWKPRPDNEKVRTEDALGRTASEDVLSVNTLPVERAAAADGVAVKSRYFSLGRPDVRRWKLGVDYEPADMGDDFSDAFDAVIAVENFHFSDDGTILSMSNKVTSVKKGDMVRGKGSTLREGELILHSGDLITPLRRSFLLSGGRDEVACLRKPRVGYIPTGSELIPVGNKPSRGENIETNSFLVKAYTEKAEAELVKYSIVKDKENELSSALDRALGECDIVLLNGGTSMGTEDYSSTLLKGRSSFYQHGVRCIPGIPVAVAVIDGKPVVNLPGPPFATFCALEWCVDALIHHWYGRKPPVRKTVKCVLEDELKKPPHFEMYVRLHIEEKDGTYLASPLPRTSRESEMRHLFNGYYVIPAEAETLEAGDTIDVIVLDDLI